MGECLRLAVEAVHRTGQAGSIQEGGDQVADDAGVVAGETLGVELRLAGYTITDIAGLADLARCPLLIGLVIVIITLQAVNKSPLIDPVAIGTVIRTVLAFPIRVDVSRPPAQFTAAGTGTTKAPGTTGLAGLVEKVVSRGTDPAMLSFDLHSLSVVSVAHVAVGCLAGLAGAVDDVVAIIADGTVLIQGFL